MDVNTKIQVCACKLEETKTSGCLLHTQGLKNTKWTLKFMLWGVFYRLLLVRVSFIIWENVMHLTAWLNFDNKTKYLLCHQKPQDGNTVLFFFTAYIYYYYYYYHPRNYYVAVCGTVLWFSHLLTPESLADCWGLFIQKIYSSNYFDVNWMNEHHARTGVIKRFHLIMSTKQTSLLKFSFILKWHTTRLKITTLTYYFQLSLLPHILHFQVEAYLGYLYPDHFWMNSHQDPCAFQCSDGFGRAKAPCSDAVNFCCRECRARESKCPSPWCLRRETADLSNGLLPVTAAPDFTKS